MGPVCFFWLCNGLLIVIHLWIYYRVYQRDFKPEIHQEPKKLAELQLGVRNFCGDFNARNKENEVILRPIITSPEQFELRLKTFRTKNWFFTPVCEPTLFLCWVVNQISQFFQQFFHGSLVHNWLLIKTLLMQFSAWLDCLGEKQDFHQSSHQNIEHHKLS